MTMAEPQGLSPGCSVLPDGSVKLVYRDAAATDVVCAGSFNGWGREPLPLIRKGGSDLWVGQTGPLPPGAHAYKYVVDGRWIADPAQALDMADGLGGRNSTFVTGMRDLGDSRALRVLSLNLHTYQEKDISGSDDSLLKLEQVAFGAAVGAVDVLLLQEVGEHVSSPSRPNAGEVIKGHLERLTRSPWHHEWREAHIGFDVYREGVSILSKGPILDPVLVPLSEGPLARIALIATIAAKGVKLRAVTVHTTWPDDGRAEIKRLVSALRQQTGGDHAATLIAGDLNAEERSPQVAELISNGYVDVAAARGATFATFGAGAGDRERPLQRRIDYQFMRTTAGRGAPRVETIQRVFDGGGRPDGLHPRVSDHAGILASFSWEPRRVP